MGVLSRAFWVQDDFECVCDEHAIYLNEHRTVSAKRTSSVVEMFVGVSPEEVKASTMVNFKPPGAAKNHAYTT